MHGAGRVNLVSSFILIYLFMYFSQMIAKKFFLEKLLCGLCGFYRCHNPGRFLENLS